MSRHETVLDAIFEDSVSDPDVEEGEIDEDEQKASEHRPMEVDPCDGPVKDLEEGEVVGEEHSPEFFPHNSEAFEVQEFANGNGNSANNKDITQVPRRKKSRKKRSGKRPKTVNVAQFVRETCIRLQEKKHALVWAAVKRLGVNAVADLLKEVDVIEKCGGQMTNDGKRRRTPGGVMWNILRGRVDPAVYKEIMSQGNEVQKQKVKEAKESVKRGRMDEKELDKSKRQKLAVKEVDMTSPGPQGKQVSQSHHWIKLAKKLHGVTDGPLRDNSSLPAIQLQKAWVEGIKKELPAIQLHKTVVERIEKRASTEKVCTGPVSLPPNNGGVVQKGTTATGLSEEKKPLPLFERLRVPVEYSDLVKDNQSQSVYEMQQVPSKVIDLQCEPTKGTEVQSTPNILTKSSAGFDSVVPQYQTATCVLEGMKAVALERSKDPTEFSDLFRMEISGPPSDSETLPVNINEVNMELPKQAACYDSHQAGE